MNSTPALIVIDTLSKTFGAGKENSDDMASYVANCQRIASEFSCLVMPIHHRPKDSESTEPRGHGSLKGGVDTIILIESGATKRAEVTKQKDAETGQRFLFDLKVIELGVDEDGDQVSSCIVQLTDTDRTPLSDPFALAISKLSAGCRLIFDQLGEHLIADGVPIPAEIPDTEINRNWVSKVVHFEAWRDKAISAAGTEAGQSRDTAKKAFNRAKQTLQTQGIVRLWNEWAWITHQLPTSTGTSAGQASGQDKDRWDKMGVPLRGTPPVRPDAVPVSASLSQFILAPGETGADNPAWDDGP